MYKFKCSTCNQFVTANDKHAKIVCSCSTEMIRSVIKFKGNRLIALRKSHNMSQLQLAFELGISKSYLSRIEHDLYPVTEILAEKLSSLFATEID